MKIYRFKNGDTCPICGQVLTGKTPKELEYFSLDIYGIATAFHESDWIYNPGEDAIEISNEILLAYFAEEEATPGV